MSQIELQSHAGQITESQGQDVWANIWCAVLAVIWLDALVLNGVMLWPVPEVLLSLLLWVTLDYTSEIEVFKAV